MEGFEMERNGLYQLRASNIVAKKMQAAESFSKACILKARRVWFELELERERSCKDNLTCTGGVNCRTLFCQSSRPSMTAFHKKN